MDGGEAFGEAANRDLRPGVVDGGNLGPCPQSLPDWNLNPCKRVASTGRLCLPIRTPIRWKAECGTLG